MTNNLIKSINERAEKEYPVGYTRSGNGFRQEGYISGATSMLPVIEDVALSFHVWLEETDFCPPPDMDTDGKLFKYFITNIYKPTT